MSSVLGGGGAEIIERAVVDAERGTSAEIMVRLTAATPHEGTVWDIAVGEFKRLALETVPEQNGLLVYVSLNRREVDVIAGPRADALLGRDTWQRIASTVASGFREGHPAQAIARAVQELGVLMAEHFPPTGAIENDLPNVTHD